MPRRVFYSFRYKYDAWRVQQIKQIGAVQGQRILYSNEWEKIKKGRDPAIKRWIDDAMKGTSCQVVLIGQATAGRKWVKYEIEKAWNDGKGVLGIHIHKLLDQDKKQAPIGRNPLDDFTVNGKDMSSIVKTYNPPFETSTCVFNHIADNVAAWVEEAIKIRKNFS